MEQIVLSSYYTSTFAKLSSDRQLKIFSIAVSEFSALGYNQASINTIAKKAEISIGAMYSYFTSKENLFLAVVEHGKSMLKSAMESISIDNLSFNKTISSIVDMTIVYSKKYPEYVKLYHALSTEALFNFSKELSESLEEDFREFYKDLLRLAVKNGDIRKNIDIDYTAYFIDNVIVMLELSMANSYHKERIQQYLGSNLDEERISQQTVGLIVRSVIK